MREVIFGDNSVSLTALPLNGAVLVRRTWATGVGNRRAKSELVLTHAELDALCAWWASFEQARQSRNGGADHE